MKNTTTDTVHCPRLAPALVATAALALTACSSLPQSSPRSVQIERTTHGIAHITAPDQEGIGYGVGYAYAQDNVCQTAQQLVTVRGERSLHFGAAAQGQLANRMLPNAQIDLFIRSHMDDAALARAVQGMSAEARAAWRGYVAGYNRYLQDTGIANLPAECRDAAWVRPMTDADMARLNEHTMVLGSAGAFADAIVAAAPPARTALAVPAPSPEEAAKVLARYSFNNNPELGEFGSNGWAFGRNATPDGTGVLLGNPHFPWIGSSRFWQMHLTIPGELEVMGASIGNNPMVQIGFNRDVAWTHTVSTGRRFTLYELQLDPKDPTAYLIDGQPRKMEAVRISVPVQGAGAPIERIVYRTQWGPVLVVPAAGLNWSSTTAYALADANAGNNRSTDTWLRMNKARSVEELLGAMRNQGLPWVNTIAADRAGQALYADLSVVPDVSAQMLQRCAPSPRAAALMSAASLPVLNGARSECAWNRDSTAAVPGITPISKLPVVVTQDWVQNSNDSFWLSNPSIAPPSEISPLVGPVGTVQRLRTRSGIQEIRARLAGSDGLPGNRMGVDEVRSVILRNRNLAGALVVDDLLAACSAAGSTLSADARTGCTVLGNWDRTSNSDSRGAPLFKEFWRKGLGVAKVWRIPFDPALPVTTPAGLNMMDSTVHAGVFKALEDSVLLLRSAGYAPDIALGEVQFRDVLAGGNAQRIPIPGGEEFEGVLNQIVPAPPFALKAGGYPIVYGSSYIQAVTFDAKGPRAYALLTYGQSSDPGSPYAFDQLAKFSSRQWVNLPFSSRDVNAQRIGNRVVIRY